MLHLATTIGMQFLMQVALIWHCEFGCWITLNDAAFGVSTIAVISVLVLILYVGAGSTLAFHTGNPQATDGSERMRIDSSGNLIVGGTSSGANSATTLYATGLVISRSTDTGGTIIADRDVALDGTIIDFRKQNATVGSIGALTSDIVIGSRNDVGFKIYAPNSDGTSSTIHPIKPVNGAAVDAKMDLGYAAGRFKDLYLSGGVYLGGTGAANKLDDYEEGTFTPTIANLTNLTGTASITRAIYTKVGNLCTIQVRISGLTITSASANSVFSATLPTAAAMDAAGTPAVMGVARGTSSFASGVVADYTGGNATQIQVLFLAETTASSGTLDIEYSLTYRTA
jgi:hypothetical protein